MALQITPLTEGEIDAFDNQSPASQNVKLGTKLQEIITTINDIATNDNP